MGKKIDGVILMIWAYIIIALPPLFILHILNSTASESILVPQLASSIPDLPTLITVVIMFPVIGALFSIFRKRIPLIFFWQLNKQDKLYIISLSLLLAIVLWHFFSILNLLNFFGFLFLFALFLMCFPITNLYINSISFHKLKQYITPPAEKNEPGAVENILFLLTVLLLIHTSVLILNEQIHNYKHFQVLLSRYPQINKIEPRIVYYSTVVIISGREFDWKQNINVKLISQYGQVTTSLWTNSKIIFRVPLHFKPGVIKLWVEKPIIWDGGTIIGKSSIQEMKLIPVTAKMGPDDDAYFDQLKNLDRETRHLNGYK